MTEMLLKETRLLTSPQAAGLLELALTGDPEASIPGFTARLDELHYRPGAEVSAIYTVSYETAPGDVSIEYLVATTAEVEGAVATLQRAGTVLRVWRHPADPRLPGLQPSCDPETVLAWLTEAGVPVPEALHVELLGYRPLRRAVLRATADGVDYYLKVLRPGYDDKLAERQNLLAAAGVTIPLLARPAPGVLISPAVAGHSLAQALVGDGPVPSADDILALLDRLPAGVADLKLRPSWSARLDFHAATARQHAPSEAARVDELARTIQGVVDLGRHGSTVPTHGDCYEANIFVDGAGLRFIDVDSAGPGLREDDLACLVAHLAVLPTLAPGAYPRVPELLREWQSAFDEAVDPADLRARTAAVLLSLVSGATSDQALVRLALAESYAAAAQAITLERRKGAL
ncbi:MAG: phosphotransferase [Tessaracoccus sp.]|uniref:phosphotransferase family protein n=1 Tax=Tessaracoccus sp. TaxID=1971211 RepID=UPI001EC79272|nr:phosphotransferase [Tessaracoccus sp.]MBK7821406.1 phosphotransferase [Tessaracoccus sp.]